MPLRFDKGTGSHLAARSAIHLGEIEIAIGTVRNHRLTRFKTEFDAVEIYRDDIRFERHQFGDAAHLGIGVGIRPRSVPRVTDRVVTTESLIRAEGLKFDWSKDGLVDVGPVNVPTWRKARLVEDQWPLGVGNYLVMMADYEVA